MKKYKFLIFLIFLILVIPSSFGATLNGSSSVYNFSVTNCQADFVNVGCNQTNIQFDCDISNSAFIDFVEFRIDGSLYNTSKTGFNWAYIFDKTLQNSTINETLSFDRIYVTDTNSDTAVFDESVGVQHDCVTCTDVGFADACSITDNTTFYHIFEPFSCLADFNESISCDYCSQDLLQTLGACSVDNTQSVQYTDLNYFSCCAVTGLASDCSILESPYNETTSQACSFLTQDFVCDIPYNAEFDERMSFSCLLPDTDDYRCIVKVFEDGRLTQVNPEFESAVPSLIQFTPTRVELKEFFTPQNRVLNAYYTKKNLLTEKDYVVEVECASNNNVYVSQELINPFYKGVSNVNNRLVWVGDNATYLLVAFFLVIIVVLIVAWAWKQRK